MKDKGQATKDTGGEGEEEQEDAAPRHVSVTLRAMTDLAVELYVKCEVLMVCSTPGEGMQKVEAALLRMSRLVREEYGGLVLTDNSVV